MAKKAKTLRLTAKRKAFLDMIQKLDKYFDDDSVFKDDDFTADDLSDAILEIFGKLPKALRNINSCADLFGSALYVLQQHRDFRDVDSCSETCKGGTPFMAAFFAGWSIGYDDGIEDAQENATDKDAQ